jgi:predicted SprT family Zn-dependent metalloprotease
METSFTYKCNKCSYEVLTSGKLDSGMLAVVDTYICKACNEIVDVCIGEHGKAYTK